MVQGERTLGAAKALMNAKVDEPKVGDISLVRDFVDVFPEDLLGLPPQRQVKFRIDLVHGATSVAKSPYRLAPLEMQEVSEQIRELQRQGFSYRPSHFLLRSPVCRLLRKRMHGVNFESNVKDKILATPSETSKVIYPDTCGSSSGTFSNLVSGAEVGLCASARRSTAEGVIVTLGGDVDGVFMARRLSTSALVVSGKGSLRLDR
ncbi:hypothetical protein Tco_1177058 [Tanacetum coccineum]